ncbi:1-(5-phosphoribosyl)-5-[(5-phosphoribosylamino)methylideneamino]imidazole-4-carboxamide isomerase [uncultured Campylobacter sp.]|uniref:1-(5-phosphoribosyl)-5-[(5- phosphoribosylamino)methylideneamino]imidazole-4- carboxamide isomerase n=1 Tax=uncultured Campylobacter sp. TaxID=218934 RepID=UPI002631F962|nr:1-(5-phosphoribosyl)-5-[(5-phosphoribosylamino)methylideneamino]imidazole-4-carboxamide isomerase [uncultured Campylobacter sp.]
MKTELIPALDLIDSKIVRLIKGDYKKKTSYDELDPLEKLKEYENMGAKWIHLVDLDGAKDPKKRQIKLINNLIQKSSVNLQVGGGIRTKDEVKALLDIGVKRVAIGSLAITNPKLCLDILDHFTGEKICIALDVVPNNNDFFIAINAWQEQSEQRLFESIEFYLKNGLKHILCTDISRDGTLQGMNISLYESIAKAFPSVATQASGGLNSLEDLKRLKGICSDIVAGKALLDGVFTVKEGLECLQNG